MLDIRQYITGYTVANVLRHPIRRLVIFVSALEFGREMRKPVYAIWEQQRRRSVCASMQSDQFLCCSLPE